MSVAHAATTASSLALIAEELNGLVVSAAAPPFGDVDAVANCVGIADRVFVYGAGRSGLAMQMTAMRLMHLGLQVHVVGEVTAPAIAAGDLLLTASGSGATTSVLRAVETAMTAGATIAALTANGESPLAALADAVLVLPAATKRDHSGAHSRQYAGSLFEQAVVLVGDAIFHALWERSGQSAEELWPRHANLE